MTLLTAGLLFLSCFFVGYVGFLTYLVKKNYDRDIAEFNRDKRKRSKR
jgi:hypothetical protein